MTLHMDAMCNVPLNSKDVCVLLNLNKSLSESSERFLVHTVFKKTGYETYKLDYSQRHMDLFAVAIPQR